MNNITVSTKIISCKLVQSQKKFLFHALNFSNSFATIDCEAHINTKFDYSINHVSKTMSLAELNTLHTICGVEGAHFLMICAKSVKTT